MREKERRERGKRGAMAKGEGRKKRKEKEERELSPANKNLEGFSPLCFSSLSSPFVNERAFLIFWSAPTETSRGCARV